MSIVEGTADYEEWLGTQTTLITSEIDLKHQKMAGSPFPFLRATYTDWLNYFPALARD